MHSRMCQLVDCVNILQAIVAIEHDLDELRKGIAKALGKKSVTYATSSGIEFLVEVKNDKASLKAVPASWQKISG